MARKYVRQLLTRGLREYFSCERKQINFYAGEITGDKEATLDWKRYEERTVLQKSVILEGWPFQRMEVEGLGLGDLRMLLEKLQKDEVKWRRLTADEIVEHSQKLRNRDLNEEAPRRKERTDKGSKRGPNKRTRTSD